MTPIEQLKSLLPRCLLPDQVRIGSRLAQALMQVRRGERVPVPVQRWMAEARASIALRERRSGLRGRVTYPAELPITAWRGEIVEAIEAHPVVVVAGETGSGKTTQLPKMCLEAGLGVRARIGCTQPRRLAAVSISRRIAEELQVEWGREVGCKIRFSDQTRADTVVKVMTDGLLLAEFQSDPLLCEYEAIVLDEAHERSLNIDFLVGCLRQLVARRSDLKVVITSATIDPERFAKAFGGAPILEVSGRLYPVEVRHQPIDEAAEETGERTYVDAAVTATESVLRETASGDVLVFMPTERDIRETCDRLRTEGGEGVEVVPLFGRLTSNEQQRVFEVGQRRRVVVATNIAETSLTVPGIRYVIDTGLARVSRYHAGTRCKRLPVEAIAQSSARQRQGRCGRIAAGVCLRLYGEADFAARPLYPEPEIRRCNLADVLLRMKAFGLGELETFPFLDPPPTAAVAGAYALLQELGALDDQRQLTDLGRELARLPVDPAIGRMVLQARAERALDEVLVVAAGLSVLDPRERPHDQKDVAAAAHRRFEHPQSDFLTLLNIWKAYHATWESIRTQSQLRKFCRAHFLSFLRMREWTDLHAQLEDALEDLEGRPRHSGPAGYAAVHRSILSGLIGHVAQRTDRNTYRLAGNRAVTVFPGSGLFARGTSASGKTGRRADVANAGSKSTQPAWIVAGELVETSRPFARMIAEIEPQWIADLAPHLVRTVYGQPVWERATGRVQVTERLLLRGLVLRERRVDYLGVNPEAATSLFLRAALVKGDIEGHCPFLEANARLRQKIEVWQTRLRQRVVPDLDEALYAFYAARLQKVGSTPELDRALKAGGGPSFLQATAADLLGAHAAAFEAAGFPDILQVGTEVLPVKYAYAPGEAHDGVTLQLTVQLAEVVDTELLEWAVPALREERVAELLRRLPKSVRRLLMPLDTAAREIAREVLPTGPSFAPALSALVCRRFGVEIAPEAWSTEALPAHLRPRLEILGPGRKVVAAGRDLRVLRERVAREHATVPDPAWAAAARRWEQRDLRGWTIGDVPDEIPAGGIAGFPVRAFPGLAVRGRDVDLLLFRKREEAEVSSGEAIPRLAETVLHREIVWLQKDLRGLSRFGDLYVTLGPLEDLLETGWLNLRQHLFPEVRWPRLLAGAFEGYLNRARELLPGLATTLAERVGAILQKRHEVLLCRRPFGGMRAELDALVTPRFLAETDFEQLSQVPRYLQALLVRAERAAVNPAKDAEKARRVGPYVRAWSQMSRGATTDTGVLAARARFRWLVEEFKVSCFAQELGTAGSVSAKRLDEALGECGPI